MQKLDPSWGRHGPYLCKPLGAASPSQFPGFANWSPWCWIPFWMPSDGGRWDTWFAYPDRPRRDGLTSIVSLRSLLVDPWGRGIGPGTGWKIPFCKLVKVMIIVRFFSFKHLTQAFFTVFLLNSRQSKLKKFSKLKDFSPKIRIFLLNSREIPNFPHQNERIFC